MNRRLVLSNSKILKTVCAPVTVFDDALLQLVRDMREVMQENRGVGLAAPQVGELVRVIVVKKQNKKGTWTVVNPTIINKSIFTNVAKEGCLSYPGIFKEIERPNSVVIRGFDERGNALSIKAVGLEARIFFHEMDHLDGVCKVGK